MGQAQVRSRLRHRNPSEKTSKNRGGESLAKVVCGRRNQEAEVVLKIKKEDQFEAEL